MQQQRQIITHPGFSRPDRTIWVVLAIWAAVIAAVAVLLWIENEMGDSNSGVYLVPWILLCGTVVLSPSAYLFYKNKFDLFHPLVFAAWSYVFPAFVVGGIIIALDFANPFFMSHVEDPKTNIPYSLLLVSIGFAGMIVGFALPVGRFLGEKIVNLLPKWEWEPTKLWGPGFLLMFMGIGVNIIGLIRGIMGYQKLEEVGIFDSLLYFLLTILTVGTILVWLGIFYAKERTPIFYIVVASAVAFIPLRMALLGSRSGLMISVMPIMMAYLYAGRKLTVRSSLVLGTIAVLAVGIGVIYGTSFRNIKGSEARVEAGEYAAQVGATIDYLTGEDPIEILGSSLQALSDRIENLSSLAVVVSNYERLAPFEASYGLENNIVNDALTSFVPRFVWPDKPNTSDARAYSDLYFNFGENSFAISPFGDLLRNFGPIGVPLGMLIVGLYLRVIYSALIDSGSPAMWKKAAYFPLLTVISYESFYAIIFPSLIRTLAVLAVSMILVNILVRGIRRSPRS